MVGKLVKEIEGFEFGRLSELATIDMSLYSTCRDRASESQISNIFDLVLNQNADEDERSWAIDDGLWDLLIHQYTLYSATPLALYTLFLSTTREQRAESKDLESFIETCRLQGSENVFLTNDEIDKNINGVLPIYSITDKFKNEYVSKLTRTPHKTRRPF